MSEGQSASKIAPCAPRPAPSPIFRPQSSQTCNKSGTDYSVDRGECSPSPAPSVPGSVPGSCPSVVVSQLFLMQGLNELYSVPGSVECSHHSADAVATVKRVYSVIDRQLTDSSLPGFRYTGADFQPLSSRLNRLLARLTN